MNKTPLDKGNLDDLEGRVLLVARNNDDVPPAPYWLVSSTLFGLLGLSADMGVSRDKLVNTYRIVRTQNDVGFVYSSRLNPNRIQHFLDNFPGDTKHVGESDNIISVRNRLDHWTNWYIDQYGKQRWWKKWFSRSWNGLMKSERIALLEDVLDHTHYDSPVLDLYRGKQLLKDEFGSEPFIEDVEKLLDIATDPESQIQEELRSLYRDKIISIIQNDFETTQKLNSIIRFYEGQVSGRTYSA